MGHANWSDASAPETIDGILFNQAQFFQRSGGLVGHRNDRRSVAGVVVNGNFPNATVGNPLTGATGKDREDRLGLNCVRRVFHFTYILHLFL